MRSELDFIKIAKRCTSKTPDTIINYFYTAEHMERKISVKKYLLAFILTLLVFGGGVILGFAIENARLEDTRQITLEEKVSLRSLQLQQNYIESGLADCKALNRVLEANIAELGRKIAIIIDYDKRAVFSQEEFELQLRDYFLTEIQFLLVSNEIDQKCSKDSLKVIYFYDENEFDTQGDILDYLKKLFGSKIMVFSFNSAFTQEPMIGILLESYHLQEFPSVVVENQVFQGHTNVEVLRETICLQLKQLGKEMPEACL